MVARSISTPKNSHSQSSPWIAPAPCKSQAYIIVVIGKNKKPKQGRMNPPKVASHATGREIQNISNMRREKNATIPVKQPALFCCLISILLLVHFLADPRMAGDMV
jgi:hypothetical protein